MKISMKVIGLTVLLLAIPGSQFAQDRAHDLASKASSQHPATCPNTTMTLQVCHDSFPDGCSASPSPNYDAYLDFLKDQDPGLNLPATKVLTAADFQNLESQLPTLRNKSKRKLTSSNHATFADQFAGIGEGNIHSVIAYLYFVEDTGQGTACQTGVRETANCKLGPPDTADYHLGLGFNSTLAANARTNHPQPCTPTFKTLEKDSFVAEMTPFPRHTHHPKWTLATVKALQGQQVKVVGQLMVDNDHFKAADDCHFSPQKPACWRSTIWEIHPVTKFFVCNLSAGCDASSPDSAWTDLDN